MVNNHDETIRRLAEFLVANAPAGTEREVARMRETLAEGKLPTYFGFEFRPEEGVCATMYVYVRGPEGGYSSDRLVDERGDTWYAHVIRCEVSWPSWGSDSVATCQRRLALMTLVTRFAAEVERAFPEVFHSAGDTVEEKQERQRKGLENACRVRVMAKMRANSKGMRAGQERRVEILAGEPDLLPVGLVEMLTPKGQKYTANVTSTRAFYITRTS